MKQSEENCHRCHDHNYPSTSISPNTRCHLLLQTTGCSWPWTRPTCLLRHGSQESFPPPNHQFLCLFWIILLRTQTCSYFSHIEKALLALGASIYCPVLWPQAPPSCLTNAHHLPVPSTSLNLLLLNPVAPYQSSPNLSPQQPVTELIPHPPANTILTWLP